MTKKIKRLIRVRFAKVLRCITYAIMMLVSAGLAYLALDFLGFIAWVLSEQTPTGFYIGKLTAEVLRLIIR